MRNLNSCTNRKILKMAGKRIMVCVDGSKNGDITFEFAAGLLHDKEDEFFVLSVAEPVATVASGPFIDHQFILDANKHIEDNTRDLLKNYGSRCAEKGLKYTCLMGRGPAKEVILKEARENKIDLLVMGRRGLNALERLLMGSATSHCVQNSPCSVLVVRLQD